LFFFSSRRRHTRFSRDWSSDVCSSDLDEDDNFDGITWRAGFAYSPHSDLSLQATYGRRQDDESLDASISYRISPKTSLQASYNEIGRASCRERVQISVVEGSVIQRDEE